MLLSTFSLLMAVATFTLYLAPTPLILGLNILMIALLLCASFASFMSSWFAFLIFLIYVGGMLVMFAYFVALTPNQNMSSTNIIILAMMSLITLMILAISSNMFPPMLSMFIHGNTLLYLKNNAWMLIILATILLLTMVIVVKLTFRSKGPLRPFN